MTDALRYPEYRLGFLSIIGRGREEKASLSTDVGPTLLGDGKSKSCEPVSPIGCRFPSIEEIRQAARYVAFPYTDMEPPTVEAAQVILEVLLRMAAGDMEAVADFERLVAGPSPWEELRG